MATIFDMQPKAGFAGMKATSVEDTVVTNPCGATPIPFGAVCGLDANSVAVPGAGTRHQGIAVHSHAVMSGANGYGQYDAVSIMRRGEIWALCKAGVTFAAGAPVKYGADGLLDPAGANTLANAFVKEAPTQSPSGQTIVYVELHAPTA